MSITYPRGFSAAGVAAGLASHGAADLALIVNDGPHSSAGAVFTSNRVQAAPVRFSRRTLETAHAEHAPIRAVALNSGGANACTGTGGYADSESTARHVATLLGRDTTASNVLICSTGLIGTRLPMDAVIEGLTRAKAQMSSSPEAAQCAARAIMTTDTVPKTARGSLTTRQGEVRVGGIAKGAGMLAPQLATMLAVLTTDAVLSHEQTQHIVSEACRVTFNRVDSDACMSTNDTVILMASGASGIVPDTAEITQLVTDVAAELARALVADAEGSSHDIRVEVTAASSEDAAEAVAREIARSNLVKAAIFGQDPNWGRIAAAAGCVSESVAPFDPDRMDIAVNGIWVCKAGAEGENRDLVDMSAREVHIEVRLHAGEHTASLWTNDLTHEYVEENSAYSS